MAAGRRSATPMSGWRLGCLVALLTLVAACSKPTETPLPMQSRVLVIGDSIAAGYGLAREQSWVAQLASLTGWLMINGGISGDTSAQGQARLASLIDEHRPVAVIIELGGNDMLRRLPTAETVATLEAMIRDVRAAGAKPVLMAVPTPSVAGAAFGNLSDAGFYGELAKRTKVPLIEDAISDVLSKPALKLDQLHPNADGHRELAAQVAIRLRKIGLLGGK